MATTRQKRRWWADRRCDTTGLASISFLGRGEPDTVAKVLVQPEVVEVWQAVEVVLLATGYGPAEIVGSIRYCPFGIGGKQCEPSGKGCSLHNYCLAIDIDPWAAGNPHFRKPWPMWSWTDVKLTKTQVRAVEAIRMLDGSKAVRWLGWAIGDTMHWEIDIPPASALSGVDWSTVEGVAPPPPPPAEDTVLQDGDEGRAVTFYQEALMAWDDRALPAFGADGDYGDETGTWVNHFRFAYDLDTANPPSTATIDGVVADLLGAYHPDRAAAKGIQGDKGDPGANGKQGTQGVQGIQGEQGPEGPSPVSGKIVELVYE